MKPSLAANDNFIERTRRLWRFALGTRSPPARMPGRLRKMSGGLFGVLVEWSRAEMPVPANDTGKPTASPSEEVREP